MPRRAASKEPDRGAAKTPVLIVNILGPIEAEAHLKFIFGEQSSHVSGHEGRVGLNPVFKRQIGILSLEADDSAEKIEARQEGFTAVPVNLYYLGEGINAQIMGDDAARESSQPWRAR